MVWSGSVEVLTVLGLCLFPLTLGLSAHGPVIKHLKILRRSIIPKRQLFMFK